MDIPDIVLALRAVEDGELDRADLPRLLTILESWERADLRVSCGELLTREFRIPAQRVRRWETEISGQPSRRIGRYQLRRRVGQGGMGIVFEAEHPNFDRPVALKILPPSRSQEPEAVQRFLTEVKSAGRFNHPNIVHAYDAGIDGDIPYLVMEFVDGENLFQVLQARGPVPIEQALNWLRDAARALLVLHEAGWIHGDVKPSNWILTSLGRLKLADLGLCRPPGPSRSGLSVFGSPPYIAPELLRGAAHIDHRLDLYSLGATFYHLLAGRPPFAATTVTELAQEHRAGEVPRLEQLRPEVPKRLARLIHALLAFDPDARPASAVAILRRLPEDPRGQAAPGQAAPGQAAPGQDAPALQARGHTPVEDPVEEKQASAAGGAPRRASLAHPSRAREAGATAGQTAYDVGAEPASDPHAAGTSRLGRRVPGTGLQPRRWLVWVGPALALVAVLGVLAWRSRRDTSPRPPGPDTPVAGAPALPGIPSSTSAEDASEINSGNPVEAARATALAEAWRARFDSSPRNYHELARWLESAAADDAQQGAWRAELDGALAAEATPTWQTFYREIEQLRAAHRYHEALEYLAQFPERLRVGRWSVETENLRTRLENERGARLARLLVDLRSALAAGNLSLARATVGALANDPPDDAAWARARIEAELGGLPWARAAHAARDEARVRAAERRTTVRAALARGEVPVPPADAAGAIDWLLDDPWLAVALSCLARHRELVPPVGGGDAGDPWRRLLDSGLLATCSPHLLTELLALLEAEPGRELALECAAARARAAALSACQSLDAAAAQRAWETLESPALDGTLAAMLDRPSIPARRARLAQLELLGSGVLAARVEVRWDETPLLAYDLSASTAFTEWRHREGSWRALEDGLQADALDEIECLVPFVAPLHASATLRTPPPPWTCWFSFGAHTLAVRRTTQHETLAVLAPPDEIRQRLEAGEGLWAQAPSSAADGNLTLRVSIAPDRWELSLGDRTLTLPIPDPPAPTVDDSAQSSPESTPALWVALGASPGTVLERIELRGEPDAEWLRARAEALGSGR